MKGLAVCFLAPRSERDGPTQAPGIKSGPEGPLFEVFYRTRL
ncbi:hypothetical protein SAMN06265338_104180 [Rhodoblastus acidophilus]|uniref:Uncharacterized protein n=1 Tax=Rhodoblastus acidophilus TaxID=1074 RepID=A0A212RGW5_RHOAC|nr:hypothetical protein SAMN06265338_104180 [Rhodoblastus acidophilus]